ncbi:MAG: CapA family protein [Butyrivibrio sp.]|nr:CapA family protein [Butyrivibrio sp.]
MMKRFCRMFQNNKVFRRLLLFFGIVVAVCAVFLFIQNSYIPAWLCWNDREEMFSDVNGTFYVRLKDKKLEVTNADGEKTFESAKEHKVQDVLVSDLDMDGDKELIVLLWKRGLYGKHRPFWVKEDEKKYSQHVFLYDIKEDGKVHEKWCASDMGVVAGRMKLMAQNDAIIMLEDKEKRCTLWMWQGWGLKNVENEVKIEAFGDNLIDRPIYEYARKHENGSFDFLYEPFLDEIQSADIAALNGETVLVDKESMVGGYPSFGSPMELGEAVKKAGFDVVSCANNHALDRGVQGIDVTKDFYENAGITCVGTQKSTDAEYRPYEIVSKKGIRIAFFSYTYGTNAGDASDKYPNLIHYLPGYETEENGTQQVTEEQEKRLISDIESARKEADFVIVFVHWGEEYNEKVSPVQEKYAQIFAKGGADVVIGTHPHVVQETKLMDRPDGKKMLVYYSLGNFRAVQGQSEQTKRGAKACFTIAHSFDGVTLASYDTKELNSYWK